MKNITEKDGVQKEWYEAAKKQTLKTLPAFLSGLMTDYGHDYGTICHALAAGAIATASAMNAAPQGGITRFQGGSVMWEFIRHWNFQSNKTGLRIIDYDNFLYPQYCDKYQKTLTEGTWKAIQAEAEKQIADADSKYAKFLLDKEQYEKDIAAFIVKYPDYNERREHYDHLGMGTGDQWDAYHEKEKSGFEFAPSEPYEPVIKHSRVYLHWESIVSGIIPFGYRIEKD